MSRKKKYRHHLIDRDGYPSPLAMRMFSRRWSLDCSTCYRQILACDFYRDVTDRYLRMRKFGVGVHKLKLKRCLPAKYGTLSRVVAEVFLNNDEVQGYSVHPATRKACGGDGDEPRAFYCDGTLFVFTDKVPLIRSLCRQVQELEHQLNLSKSVE